MIKVPFKVFQVDSNDCGHIVKLKGFFLVCFQTIFLENIRVNVVNHFGSSNQDVDISFHPKSQGIEFEIDWILVVVKTDVFDMGPFEEHVVPVNLSEVLA